MKSKIGKISAILFSVLIIFLSLFVINIVKAQNVSLNDSLTGYVLENFENITDNETVSNEILNDSTNDWGGSNESIDEIVENVTGNNSLESLENETSENITNPLGNVSQNISLNQTNETSQENETSSEQTDEIIVNNTNNTSSEPTIENETSLPTVEGSDFDIDFEYVQKITRGETVTVKGVATANSNIKNVVLNWILPENFEIISGNNTISCGNLTIASSCESEINIKTSSSTDLGIIDVKIVVNYEK